MIQEGSFDSMKRFLAVTLCLIMCFVTFNSLAATKGEENALKKAQNYLSITNYSYNGLCEQLAFVGFSDSECKYAADHCGADWYEQAGCQRTLLRFTAGLFAFSANGTRFFRKQDLHTL